MRAIEKIELHFGMSFKKIMTDLHIKEGISILELSKRCGFSRDCFQKEAKKLGLKIMTRQEAALRKYEHHTHWAIGLTKENSYFGKMHSLRMKKNNPGKDPEIRKKMSVSLSKIFKERMLPQELLFKEILDKHCVEYIPQHPIEQFIIDFFIPSLNLCIEIDSTDKWCSDKRRKAKKKDLILKNKGFEILRINKKYLNDDLFMKQILINHILNSNNGVTI